MLFSFPSLKVNRGEQGEQAGSTEVRGSNDGTHRIIGLGQVSSLILLDILLATLDLFTRRSPESRFRSLLGGHEEHSTGGDQGGTQDSVRLLSCLFLIGSDSSGMDRDGEDAGRDGSGDEFTEGEFFGVEDAVREGRR
jgi:hypothetical protein